MKKTAAHYMTITVDGESVRAFVPSPLPPRLLAKDMARLVKPLRSADAALSHLNLAGEMIPSIDWFIYAFLRKEALLSSAIEETQATLVDVFSFEHADQLGTS